MAYWATCWAGLLSDLVMGALTRLSGAFWLPPRVFQGSGNAWPGKIAEFLTEIGPRLHALFGNEPAGFRLQSARQWRSVLSIARVGSPQVILPGDANVFGNAKAWANAGPRPGMGAGFVSALMPIETQRWLLALAGLRAYQGAGA